MCGNAKSTIAVDLGTYEMISTEVSLVNVGDSEVPLVCQFNWRASKHQQLGYVATGNHQGALM